MKRVLAAFASLLVSQFAGHTAPDDRVPASSPALSPEEAQKKFVVPEGFEVRLFASEPMVINPVAMSWDERGRLWVVELFEYPSGAKPGTKPRDQVKVLEDTDNDGRADKMTVFADGLDLATGILIGNGGVYVGQAPDLLFYRDLDGDDIADSKQVVLTGFGLEDRHELLNSFTWGPDGQLYMTHGVFTHSKVRAPGDIDTGGEIMNAAVARVDTRNGHRFEVYADGTSNPWGVDFDKHGEAFLSACVIDHMFHMAPGGLYARQGGSPEYKHAYELLPSIVDHAHFRAAYAGVQIYQADAYPPEYRDKIYIGNIHGNCVHQDVLTPQGSTFLSQHGQDFLTTDDGWFRPVSTQTGPDGNLWVMDWCDKYPCYQNAMADPEGVDREFGRIWRVVYTGEQTGKSVPSRPFMKMDLSKTSSSDLVELLESPNNWQRRTARRLLNEQGDRSVKDALIRLLHASGETVKFREKPRPKPVEHRLEALWTLHASGMLDGRQLDALVASPEPALRLWAARLTGERRSKIARLEALASDPEPSVRRAVATALRQFSSARLTVNEPVVRDKKRGKAPDPFPVIEQVMRASGEENDRGVSFHLWTALEPIVASKPKASFERLLEPAADSKSLGWTMIMRTARRMAGDPSHLDYLSSKLPELLAERHWLVHASLDGILRAQRDRVVKPKSESAARALFAALREEGDDNIKALGQELGTLWGDPESLAALITAINDPESPRDQRLTAIKAARKVRGDVARDALLKFTRESDDPGLLAESVRGLGEIGGEAVPTVLLERWPLLTGPARTAAAGALAGREPWALELLDSLESGNILRSEIPPNILQRLTSHGSNAVKAKALAVIGRYRPIPGQMKTRIAEKKQAVINGPVDLATGRAIAQGACLICHQFHGEGVAVGPDLTGSGRSNLDALLNNVLDPDQIIGRGYENHIVETKEGLTVTGRLVSEDDSTIKLLGAGGIEQVIEKTAIKTRTDTGKSVMPGGFAELPDADFRDLMWYILNPPQDNRPLTPQLRAELIGAKAPQTRDKRQHPPVDMESVSLWNPDWHVVSPPFEGAPNLEPDFHGRKNVLRTHPVDQRQPATLERFITIPENATKATLNLTVSTHDHEEADWKLRVLIDGTLSHEQIVTKAGSRWQKVNVDLSEHKGRQILLRLENAANNWMYEFGYWGEISLDIEPGQPETQPTN